MTRKCPRKGLFRWEKVKRVASVKSLTCGGAFLYRKQVKFMSKKKVSEEVLKEKPREEVEFRGVPLEELKNRPDLHEAYESAYGYAELSKLL